jgi:hypothetical protein
MQLFAVDATHPNIQTVNNDVLEDSDLTFVSSLTKQPAYPFYCALVCNLLGVSLLIVLMSATYR